MEKFIHNILEDNDHGTIECKDKYNEALINNAELQILHEKMEVENKTMKIILYTPTPWPDNQSFLDCIIYI